MALGGPPSVAAANVSHATESHLFCSSKPVATDLAKFRACLGSEMSSIATSDLGNPAASLS
jgi:hypothetical protein